jgi:hypothetical protein
MYEQGSEISKRLASLFKSICGSVCVKQIITSPFW